MPAFDLSRRLAAEALGTALLVATVVGSGIMAESLTKDVALALLGNTVATGAILVVLITMLGPISGAHFNPAVTLVFLLKRDLPRRDATLYVVAQIAGGIAGAMIAHGMFDLPLLQASLKVRSGGPQWFAEFVATFGLVATILAGLRFAPASIPTLVGLYITAAYWFTASTSFANPAVAIALVERHFFRHPPAGRARLHRRAMLRGGHRAAADALAAARHTNGTGSNMTVTIYHNPDCGTSRNTLAMIRASGETPVVIEYLKTPPDRARLVSLIDAMGISARALLREKGTPFAALGLGDPKWSDAELIDMMLEHPILINRPIVETLKGTLLCRPSEIVLELLDNPPNSFIKEDGEIVTLTGQRDAR